MRKILYIGSVLWCSFGSLLIAQQPQEIASGLPNMEVVTFSEFLDRYLQSHGQKPPANWSEIWDAAQIARVGMSYVGQPLVYRRIAFVNETPRASADPLAPRILAITREPFERSWKDNNSNVVMQRAVIAITPQNKIRVSFIAADKPFWKTNLTELDLKDPDPSPKQLADTLKVMFDLGFSASQIYAALGNDDIEAVKKSGALDSGLERALDEKAPQLASAPTVSASTPRSNATATPVVATEKSSSGFPIVLMVILAAVIAGAAVFFFRRKQP